MSRPKSVSVARPASAVLARESDHGTLIASIPM
jgi:hypothetical protein